MRAETSSCRYLRKNACFFAILLLIGTKLFAQKENVNTGSSDLYPHLTPKIDLSSLTYPTTNYMLAGYDFVSLRPVPSTSLPPIELHYVRDKGYPNIFKEQAPIRRGEFNVSGPMARFENGIIMGKGYQQNLLGIGQFNHVSITYLHTFNEQLYWVLQLQTNKLSAPYRTNQDVGAATKVTYQVADKVGLHAFGAYSITPQNGFQTYNFGATISYDFTDRWGLEMGANRYYDNFSNRWNTDPVVIPYYRLNKDTKLGFDFGPIIKGLIIDMRDKNDRNHRRGNPTIAPPRPEFPYRR